MEELKNKMKKVTGAKLFFPIVMNLVVMFVLTLLFYATYQCEMDIFMQTLLYGTGVEGDKMSHLVFINIVLGGIVAGLARIFPKVAWYTVMHYAATYTSLVAISYAMTRRNNNKLGRIIATVLSIFIGYECYITPMYMKTAILLTTAAIALLGHAMTKSKKGVIPSVFAFIFAVAGSMMSFKVFLTGALISLVGLLYFWFLGQKKIHHKLAPLISVALVIITVLVTQVIDQKSYTQENGWDILGQNRQAMEKVYVMGYPAYDQVEEAILENGFEDYTPGSYYRVCSGSLEEGMDNLTILRLASEQQKDMSKDNVMLFFRTMPIKAFRTGMFYAWLILAILVIATRKKNRSWEVIAISVAMFWLPYFVQYFLYGADRQWMGMIAYMPAIVFLLLNMGSMEIPEEENRYVVVYLALGGLVLYYLFSGTFNGAKTEVKEMWDVIALQEDEPQYIHIVDACSYFSRFSIYAPYPKQVDCNNVYIGEGLHSLVPGVRKTASITGEGVVGYKLYARSEDRYWCMKDNLKQHASLKGCHRYDHDAFHGLAVCFYTREKLEDVEK